MKILISGSTGFIGKYLTNSFRSKDHEVWAIGQSDSSDFQVDLAKKSIEIYNEYDLIIHCAGIVHNELHALKILPELLLKDITMTKNLIKSVKSCNYKKIIFLSSVAIYGLNSGTNISEREIPNPKSGYGISKYVSENFFESTIDSEKLLILRLPLVNGPNPKGNIHKLEKAIMSNRMVLFANNPYKKSLLEISDLYEIIANHGNKLYGVYNIKSYDFKFNELAEKIAGNNNKKIFKLPIFLLITLKFIAKILNLNKIYTILSKMSNNLTFDNSLITEKIENDDK